MCGWFVVGFWAFFFFGLWPVVVFNGGVGFQYGVDL